MGRRVLLVEDNRDSRETLREVLELLGHRVVTAGSGPEGVAAAQEELPEVALVDIGLPGFDGYEVGRRIRALTNDGASGAPPGPTAQSEQPGEGARSTPFLVALTGYGREEDRRQAVAAGFDAHLTKPVDLATLEGLLASVGGDGAALDGPPHGRRQ